MHVKVVITVDLGIRIKILIQLLTMDVGESQTSIIKYFKDSRFNPNHIGVKYSLDIIRGGGGKLSLYFALLICQILFFYLF